MDPAALRAEFPVLERIAYLNAGTDGPLAAAAVRLAQAELEAELDRGAGDAALRAALRAAGAAARGLRARDGRARSRTSR